MGTIYTHQEITIIIGLRADQVIVGQSIMYVITDHEGIFVSSSCVYMVFGYEVIMIMGSQI